LRKATKRVRTQKQKCTTTALALRSPTAIDVYAQPTRALATRPKATAALVKRKPLDVFVEWLMPRLKREFETPAHVIEDARQEYRRDKRFRSLVNKGERAAARRELWELLGVIDG
jgi:hypothetical protein